MKYVCYGYSVFNLFVEYKWVIPYPYSSNVNVNTYGLEFYPHSF